MRIGLISVVLAAVTSFGVGSSRAADETVSAWRLFVSTHEPPAVHVFDALSRKALAAFPMKSPGWLYRSESGETVFAAQRDAGKVSAIASGIGIQDHGDHGDIDVRGAKMLGFALQEEKPGHVVAHKGNVAFWFDGEPDARIVSESAVLSGKAKPRTVHVGAPHHGVAVPYDSHAVVTIPGPADSSQRIAGARVVGYDGKQVGQDVACPNLHGEAISGNLALLACENGLLFIEQKRGIPQVRHVPYPAFFPEGSRVSTLAGGQGLQYFIGNLGSDRVVVIDPSANGSIQQVELPTRRIHFAVDPVRPRLSYIFTADGKLHQLDVVASEITKSLNVIEPYPTGDQWRGPLPRIAVAGEHVVLTDPRNNKIHLIDAAQFTKAGEIPLAGMPFSVVAVGGTGRVHEK